MKLSATSLARLKGVHPDLVRVVKRAADLHPVEFRITCGLRTLAEQKILVARGASKTMKSRHLPGRGGFSHAVDVAFVIDGKLRWDWPLFDAIAKTMKRAAALEKVPIEWGGDWKTFKDGPHFQLPWKQYP